MNILVSGNLFFNDYLVNRANSIEEDIIGGPFYGWSIHM